MASSLTTMRLRTRNNWSSIPYFPENWVSYFSLGEKESLQNFKDRRLIVKQDRQHKKKLGNNLLSKLDKSCRTQRCHNNIMCQPEG
jgi:hypothetical protein